MECWILFTSFVCLFVAFVVILSSRSNTKKLPPSPATFPIIGNFLLLLRSSKNFAALEPILRDLRSKHGPIVTLKIGLRPAIFISSPDIAHKALVQSGAMFASRPPALETSKILLSNQHTITSAAYGPLWRTLRQNFMSLIHPSKLYVFTNGRKWAVKNLIKDIRERSQKSNEAIPLLEHIQHSIYSLLLFMCFGQELEKDLIRRIVDIQRAIMTNFIRFNTLNFMPRLGKLLFKNLWKEFMDIVKAQENCLLPLIQAKKECKSDTEPCYIDTLLNLKHPDEDREFTYGELVSLCSEFINAGTDTSATALQWVMANLVKYQHIQEKVVEEIKEVVGEEEEIKEEHIKRMPYLKAVVLETLRRHPPGHFILPRAVVEDTKLEGYDIPKDAIVNFTVAEMARDERVWEDPMEFKPERFMADDGDVIDFDIKGVQEIKMMPFGAGRRVCPAISLAIYNQQYYVANLLREFKWLPRENGEVDLSETQDFTIVMKNPLKARVVPRTN